MNKFLRVFIIVGFIGFLGACSSTFKSNVSRFHELPKPNGETVSIVPANPEWSVSLEFASYANIVGNYLSQQGYRPAGDGEPDLIVELGYGVDDGKVMIRSYPSAFSYGFGYGGYGFGYGGYGYGFGYGGYGHGFGGYGGYLFDPYWGGYGGFGGYNDIRSYVNYTRRLSMVIRPNNKEAKNLFEGTVESRGRSNDLPKLMPLMVQAMFTNFPGENGVTDKVVIDLDKK